MDELMFYDGKNVQRLHTEYSNIFGQYMLMRTMGLPHTELTGFMLRAWHLYQANSDALNNGYRGNPQLINNQLGLETMLGIRDCHIID